MSERNITNVTDKLAAFWEDHEQGEWGIRTDFSEDEVGTVARVVGHCKITRNGEVVAEAFGTRALREPKPGAQGMNDTRDPDRAMTQATGRALGLLGYFNGSSLEGDTDEQDGSGVETAAQASSRNCARCEQPIVGQVRREGGKNFHPDCLEGS